MKWYDVKKYKIENDRYYIVRMRSDFESHGSFEYKGLWFENNEWLYDEEDIEEKMEVTHFCIPDLVEIEE